MERAAKAAEATAKNTTGLREEIQRNAPKFAGP